LYMERSCEEDLLEAVLCLGAGGGAALGPLASRLHLTPKRLLPLIDDAVRAGTLTRSESLIGLTEEGREIAVRIDRRHRTLQCFLTEMLGMDPSSASDEACQIEHRISDETISRLGTYMARPGGNPECPRRCSDQKPVVRTLQSFDEGTVLRVSTIRQWGHYTRLLDLGILPGEEISIRRKLGNGAVVVRVKGCDIALSPEIATSISVERVT
jgi:DtxR family Mn-dependent transcriptional regulator